MGQKREFRENSDYAALIDPLKPNYSLLTNLCKPVNLDDERHYSE
jgi:hypothetical protein